MFYSVSVYCVLSLVWKTFSYLMYFVQFCSGDVDSKCPAPNRPRRVVPGPSWPRRFGIAESAPPSCSIPDFKSKAVSDFKLDLFNKHVRRVGIITLYYIFRATPPFFGQGTLWQLLPRTFYPRDAVERVFARATCLSVRPAVRYGRYCMKTERASVMISSPSDSPMIWASGKVWLVEKFARSHPERGRFVRLGWVRTGDFCDFST